jgi:hypothetical protein
MIIEIGGKEHLIAVAALHLDSSVGHLLTVLHKFDIGA